MPGRVEFAVELRRAILRRAAAGGGGRVAGRARAGVSQSGAAVARDVGVWFTEEGKDEDRAVYVPVEPADPFTEAIRSGLEVDAEILFIEPDVIDRPHVPDNYPDPYSIRRIGLDKYVEAYRVLSAGPHRRDRRARRGDGLETPGRRSGGPHLVVVSLNMLDALLDAMEQPQEGPPAAPPPLKSSTCIC